MKIKLSIAFGSLLLATVLTLAQETSGQQTDAAEQELITLSTQWMEALERKDRDVLERFLADDFFVTAPGSVEKTERGEWLKNAIEMDWSSLQYHNFRVNIYGETAVVTALLDFKVTTGWGIPISSDAQVTDIWVKRNGRWQVAARHLGAYSLDVWIRGALGFIAGLSLCFAIWLALKLRRRFAAKRLSKV
jgi:ketosteroid isomerase-like protein